MNSYSTAKDFRSRARNALKGNWFNVILTTLVASVFGATVGTGAHGISPVQLVTNIPKLFNQDTTVNYDYNLPSQYNQQDIAMFLGIFSIVFGIGLIFTLVAVLLGAVVSIGLCQYNLKLIDGEVADIGILFKNFNIWSSAVWLAIRRGLFIFLWSLLFVIPGIIKSFSYAMSFFIMSENPEISAKEAMEVSTKMMQGNKWRLFCLSLSFIGWDILNLFTLGIGSLWLVPYKNAAATSFYDEISRKPVNEF